MPSCKGFFSFFSKRPIRREEQPTQANFAVANINISGALTVKGEPISYTDLKDLPVILLPCYLQPITMTMNLQEVPGPVTDNGVYLYECSITADIGMFRLKSFKNVIRYANLQ